MVTIASIGTVSVTISGTTAGQPAEEMADIGHYWSLAG